MPRMTEEQFLALLAELRLAIEDRDSMEGTISWCWTDEPGVYNVTGMYRVGNSEGQGGTIILRGEAPSGLQEARQAMDPLPGALT